MTEGTGAPIVTTATDPVVTPAGNAPAPVAPAAPTPAAPVAPVAPAAPVAPVAPTAPVQPDPAQQQQPAEKPQGEVYVPSHSDPAVRAVENLLAEKGVTQAQFDTVFAEAFRTNSVDAIDIKKLSELVGETNANLAMQSLRAYDAQCQATAANVKQYACTAFGSEGELAKAVAWAKQNMSHPSLGPELAQIRAQLEQGEVQAKLAIDMLKMRYASHSTNPQGTGALVSPDGGNAGLVAGAPFASRVEYVTAVKEARASGDPAKLASVQARFAISTNLHQI